MVQGSAYGNEHRFPLRAARRDVAADGRHRGWCGARRMLAAVLLLGAAVSGSSASCSPRWPSRPHVAARHRASTACSRRWLVLVPAGVVVHDRCVLGETLMVQRTNVAARPPRAGRHRGRRPHRSGRGPRRRPRRARHGAGRVRRRTASTQGPRASTCSRSWSHPAARAGRCRRWPPPALPVG